MMGKPLLVVLLGTGPTAGILQVSTFYLGGTHPITGGGQTERRGAHFLWFGYALDACIHFTFTFTLHLVI